MLFHNISDSDSPFTKGLGGTVSRQTFEATLRFLTTYFTPVSLQDVLASFNGGVLPRRPVLVTFDDAYASVTEVAAPLCAQFGVPAVFFVNAACLDNREIALDNLVCYVANTVGLNAINAAICELKGEIGHQVVSLAEVFSRFLPGIPLRERKAFHERLLRSLHIGASELAKEAHLYVTSKQLRELAAFGVEIGDHTYSHVNCRVLMGDEFDEEIDRNRVKLEALSGRRVRSFSIPYGSSADLSGDLLRHLQRRGYEAVFLAEGRTNSSTTDNCRLNRISMRGETDSARFSEIEVLPRLRAIRNSLLGGAKAGNYKSALQLNENYLWQGISNQNASSGTASSSEPRTTNTYTDHTC
ncbi:MAG TPA: polysaccharide deacetylase family protein [Terriglobales bacterium]|nr:polysaccharide deacetylase family protein [Terriglobales bacterium]